MTPFDIWAPIFRAPFSGNVTQEIKPSVLSPSYQGNADIEHRVQTEVASYGKQIGKILEALQLLSEAADTPLPEIEKIVTQVEAIKAENKEAVRKHAEKALQKLREVDEAAWIELRNR